MAEALTRRLKRGNVDIHTSLENRSIKTKNRAQKLNVKISGSNRALARECDILISAVTPANALDIAREVANHVKGVYVDLNNISPQTTRRALEYIENGKTVDAAVMGSVKGGDGKVLILASGPCAGKFAQLNSYGLNIKVLDWELGKVKALKMLRSQYTKGVSALLFESFIAAYKLGLDEELLKCLELTEGYGFRKSATSRINSSAVHAKRRAEELNEIIEFQKHITNSDDEFQEMVKATRTIFRQISLKSGEMEIPEDYRDVLKLFSEK